MYAVVKRALQYTEGLTVTSEAHSYMYMHVCMHACMYVCLYGWMDVCM